MMPNWKTVCTIDSKPVIVSKRLQLYSRPWLSTKLHALSHLQQQQSMLSGAPQHSIRCALESGVIVRAFRKSFQYTIWGVLDFDSPLLCCADVSCGSQDRKVEAPLIPCFYNSPSASLPMTIVHCICSQSLSKWEFAIRKPALLSILKRSMVLCRH